MLFVGMANNRVVWLMWTFPHKNYMYDGLSGRLIRLSEDTIDAIKTLVSEHPNEPIVIEGLTRNKEARAENLRPIAPNGNIDPVHIKVVITEQCNLCCSYCPYPEAEERAHTPFAKGLSEDKINSIIQLIIANAKSNTILSFYGGEPLFRFKDIELISDSVKSHRPDWGGALSLTSNMTAFSTKIAKFLSENKVVLVASIDGPKSIHDLNRVHYTGRGTFSQVIENMKRLRDYDPEYYQSRVGINAVVTTTNFNEIDEFFATEFPDICSIRFSIAKNSGALKVDRGAIRDRLYDWVVTKFLSCSSVTEINRSPLLKDFIRNYLVPVIDRKCVQDGRKAFTSCLPGSHLIINTDMSVGVCERTEGLSIGTIGAGITLNTDDIANSFADLLEKRCRFCFAAPTCAICYAVIWDGRGLSKEKLDAYCDSYRGEVERYLEIYTHLRERFGMAQFDNYVESVVKR